MKLLLRKIAAEDILCGSSIRLNTSPSESVKRGFQIMSTTSPTLISTAPIPSIIIASIIK